MKPCFFIASSKADIADFPESVRSDLVRRGVGYSLFEAQTGLAPLNSKPLKGFGGRSVVEVVEDHRGDTYRAVYTVRFAETAQSRRGALSGHGNAR